MGCDVVPLHDIEQSMAAFGSRYLRKSFTDNEIEYCTGADRVARLAARFAAKEAVIKAFADPSRAYPLREIEIVNIGPIPTLSLTGSAARLAELQKWRSVSVSLTHAECHAAAAVFVLCGAS